MRRFDPDYLKMKEIISSGALGLPLMAHCFSRTPRIADTHTTAMHITNIAIHEVDLFRWLLGEEFERVQVLFPRSTSFAKTHLQDPQMVIMESKSGVLIDVEVAGNSYYGYEIGCELVFEKGSVQLPAPSVPIMRTRLAYSEEIPDSWANRFPQAYMSELEHWIKFIKGETQEQGPSSLDGYAASIVTDALITSQNSQNWEKVLIPK